MRLRLHAHQQCRHGPDRQVDERPYCLPHVATRRCGAVMADGVVGSQACPYCSLLGGGEDVEGRVQR